MRASVFLSLRRAGALGLVMASSLIAACGPGAGEATGAGGNGGAGGTGDGGAGGTGDGGAGGGAGGGTGGGAGGGTGGGSSEVWEWCPKAEDYVGDPSWTATVEVTENALYCGTFDESKTLEETLAAKSQLRVVPGTYKIPAAATKAAPSTLPHCVRFLEDGTQPLHKGVGELTADFTAFGMETNYSFRFYQPMDAAGEAWFSEIQLQGPWDTNSPKPLLLDGQFTDSAAQHLAGFYLCKGADCLSTLDRRLFNSCSGEGAATQHTHTISFEGGDIKLVLRIGESFGGTEPGAFVRGSGKLDGTAFDQASYWKLIYRPEHHHFVRHFAVLFDAPIGAACGLKVEDVLSDPKTTRVNLIDCGLSNLEERKILSEDHQKTP